MLAIGFCELESCYRVPTVRGAMAGGERSSQIGGSAWSSPTTCTGKDGVLQYRTLIHSMEPALCPVRSQKEMPELFPVSEQNGPLGL